MKKPNILFFFSDQQRPDTMGCYGQKLPVTPVLDQLAKEGVLFQNAYTCQPVCGPARACLQTGQYATALGCYRNDEPLPLDVPTIAGQLHEVGYETAYVGKWHLASGKRHGIDYQTSAIPAERRGGYQDFWVASDLLEFTSHGYDGYVFDGDNNRLDFVGYRPDCLTDYAMQYLRQKESDNPFFLFISQIEPHHQNDHFCYEGPIGSKAKFKEFEAPADLTCRDRKGDWEENYPDYLGQCNSLDYNMGRLIDLLKEKGEYENTIIIYTSDHGSHFRTRDGEYKRQCFDSCLHIPMIVRGGEFLGGKELAEMVSLINLPSTILQVAGVSIPEQMKEAPLQQLLAGEDWQEEVFFQVSEQEVSRGIRTSRYKYTVHAPQQACLKQREPEKYTDEYLATLPPAEQEEIIFSPYADSPSYQEQYLFDLETDPTESVNLIAQAGMEDLKQQLQAQLLQRMERAGEAIPEILSATV